MEIHQILPTISPGDAIGNEVREIKSVLNKWGYKSEIYAQNIHPGIDAKNYTEYKKVSSKENILIFSLFHRFRSFGICYKTSRQKDNDLP